MATAGWSRSPGTVSASRSRSATAGASRKRGGASRSSGTTARSSAGAGWRSCTTTGSPARGTWSGSTTEDACSASAAVRSHVRGRHENQGQPEEHGQDDDQADDLHGTTFRAGLEIGQVVRLGHPIGAPRMTVRASRSPKRAITKARVSKSLEREVRWCCTPSPHFRPAARRSSKRRRQPLSRRYGMSRNREGCRENDRSNGRQDRYPPSSGPRQRRSSLPCHVQGHFAP